MPESIFSILNLIWFVFIVGIALYMVGTFLYLEYLNFSSRDIFKSIEEEKKYDRYLESHGCKQYEYAFLDEYEGKEKNIEAINEIHDKRNKLKSIELNLCNEFIRNNPNNMYARERRASLYFALGNYEESINEYRYLIKKEPKNFSHVRNCAFSYAYWNDLNSALGIINNFYRNKKQDSEYFDALGSVFNISKDYQLALKNHSEAIKLNPHWLYYSNRAAVYRRMGDMDKYQEDYKKYKELQKKSFNEDENGEIKTQHETDINSKPFYKNPAVYKFAFIFLVIIAISYFHPTKEVMYCTPNQICNIERTYFGTFTINKKIILNSASNMSCHMGAYARGRHNTDYGLYLRFDGVAPFVFYVADSSYRTYEYQKEELDKICNQYYQGFKQYINNYGKYQFRIKSKADTGKLIFSIIMILILLLVVFGEDVGKIIKK